MTPVPRCPHCEGVVDLPHETDAACFRALDREIAAALKHMRTLTKRKGKLLRARIRSRQRTVTHKTADIRGTQRMLAGALGPRNSRPPLMAARRLSRSK